MTSKKLAEKLKWVATMILIVGAFVNALGLYPLGPIILLLGGAVWLTVSIIWKEPALIATNAVMFLASLSGLIIGLR